MSALSYLKVSRILHNNIFQGCLVKKGKTPTDDIVVFDSCTLRIWERENGESYFTAMDTEDDIRSSLIREKRIEGRVLTVITRNSTYVLTMS